MNKIYFTKTNPNVITPTKGSPQSAAYDLYAHIDKEVVISSNSTVKIPTGLSIQPMQGFFGAIFPRSGLATKHNIRLANCVGVCDEDYTGEYLIALHNDSNRDYIVKPNDRIAQLVFLPYVNVEFVEVEKLDETERGENGFGSSGR